MSELEKYRILRGENLPKLEVEINSLVEQGYKLHTFTTVEFEGEHIRHLQYVAVMSLSSSNKYDNIGSLIDVEPSEVNSYLEQGYIVTDSWSKSVRMVKKKEAA